MKKIILLVICFLFLCAAGVKLNYAAEPSMIDYTSYPLFMADTVAPNILIILDNSGSMNFNAYGPWPGNGGTVNDSFMGEPYKNILDVRVSQNYDDAEERKSDGYSYYENDDLDLGRDIDNDYPNQIIGVRFQNIKIPQGADITNAYIEFETYADYGGNQADISLSINGEAGDSAARFETTDHNMSSRSTTATSVDWEVGSWDTVGETHQSPDLKAIVQEVVNRGGWSEGNSMAFIITNPGADPASGRRTTSHDANSAAAPLLHIEFEGVSSTKYYGYFNPDYFYYWDSNKFDHKYKKVKYVGDPAAGGYWKVEDLNGISHNLSDAEIATGDPSTGLWDGNWLNWLCMRRIDVLRKVLMGGLVTSRTGGGNQVTYGEDPVQNSRTFIKRFDSSTSSAVSPYDGDFFYGMKAGYIYVDDDSSPFSGQIERLEIKIQKNILYEPQDFQNYDNSDNLAGILQRFADKARWGNEFFNDGTGNNQSGGSIASTIGTNMTSLITNLQNKRCDTWTPLAEAYYVAMQYFKQEDVQAGLDYKNNVVPNANLGDDPYWNGSEYVYCAKSFVILLTDGASTKDSMIPDFLKDVDGDGDNTACNESNGLNCDYESGGTDYLDDVALYARTTDLREDLEGDQNLILYTVFALADDEDARKLLKDAARNGGFEDRNGDGIPNGDYSDAPENRKEWDKDGNGIPDTYFEASDGYKLERELGKAITDILARAASGTAVSVISTSGQGEGNLVQAYFKPTIITDTEEIKWVGYLQSLWLDDRGNMREDTDHDLGLNVTEDRIIKYVDVNGETKVQRYPVTADEPYPDLNATTPVDTVGMEEISPLWEAGIRLAQRDPDDRKIFTYIDKDKDG
jgi:type IV pilus assembly protein PilY1